MWAEIDDKEELFLTVKRFGGRNRITDPEEDQLIANTALTHNFSSIKELKLCPEVIDNPNIGSASESTIRRRLEEKGFIVFNENF